MNQAEYLLEHTGIRNPLQPRGKDYENLTSRDCSCWRRSHFSLFFDARARGY